MEWRIALLAAAVFAAPGLPITTAQERLPPPVLVSPAGEEPFSLGGRTIADLPPLTEEELASPQQLALMSALGGDPYGHRAADHERAGCAMLVRPHAIRSNTRYYGGYFVGGGNPIQGDEPYLDEGTFGWDYFGILFPKRVALNWSHGRRYQGGLGAYKTDGPKLKHE